MTTNEQPRAPRTPDELEALVKEAQHHLRAWEHTDAVLKRDTLRAIVALDALLDAAQQIKALTAALERVQDFRDMLNGDNVAPEQPVGWLVAQLDKALENRKQ